MLTDPQTRRDLELFEARDGGASVFATLDRTRTRAGRRRLRTMLERPLSDASAIRDRQDAIRHLHAIGYRFPVPDALVEGVQAYIDSNFATLSDRGLPVAFGESVWIAVRYRELLRHARGGVLALRRLLAAVHRLLEPLETDPGAAPVEVNRIRDEIRSLTGRLNTRRLQRATSFHSLLVVDRELRSESLDDVRTLLRLVAEVDALAATAALLGGGYTLSVVVEDDGAHLEGEGLRHPFLPEGTPNPVSLRGGETLVFLTGPNMAGKTTYLKAVGICIHLAHCGLPVPAGRFAFAPVDRFITGLSPEDNLREGISFFLAEVRRVKEVLTAVADGARTIAIFDEVFRGTNVADALEASKTVLLGCSRAATSTFIFSSHLVELAEELEEIPSVKFRRFDGELDGARLRFDYRLRPGVSDKRFGMELLRREGLPALLDAIPDASVA